MTAVIDPFVYQAAHQTAILVDRSDLGMLKINGETRLDLINRMSTQAVKGLQTCEGTATILTTDIGRIIDRLILYAGSDSVYALTGEDNGDNIARYLMRYVFFMDDFHIKDISSETAIYAIYGPQAARILGEQVGFPEVDIPMHHWREAEIAGTTAYLHRTDPINQYGYFITCEAANSSTVRQFLSETSLTAAPEPAFDLLRIEAGSPRFGRELTQEYIPLEAGLWDDVSFNKGCYTGQEIIARMESRGKLAKRLVSLRSNGTMQPGSAVQSESKTVGSVTSAAAGLNGSLALAYIRTAALEKGTDFAVGETAVSLA